MNEEKFFEIREKMKDYEYRVINKNNSRILTVRSPNKYPDIVNDVERLVERIKIDDMKSLTNVCLIGEKEVINVQPRIIDVLVRSRKEHDDKIVEKMREKLGMDESTSFRDDDDPNKLCRFALRISTMIEEYPGLIKKMEMPPDGVSIIYIIGHDGYVRIMADDFVKMLRSKERYVDKIKEKFVSSGYKIINLEDVDTAGSKDNYRIIAKYFDRASLKDAENALNTIEKLRADVELIVSISFPKELKRFAMGKKIELVKADEIEELIL